MASAAASSAGILFALLVLTLSTRVGGADARVVDVLAG
jgi:hypothetical protein